MYCWRPEVEHAPEPATSCHTSRLYRFAGDPSDTAMPKPVVGAPTVSSLALAMNAMAVTLTEQKSIVRFMRLRTGSSFWLTQIAPDAVLSKNSVPSSYRSEE